MHKNNNVHVKISYIYSCIPLNNSEYNVSNVTRL